VLDAHEVEERPTLEALLEAEAAARAAADRLIAAR
jgi:hypothetical protein